MQDDEARDHEFIIPVEPEYTLGTDGIMRDERGWHPDVVYRTQKKLPYRTTHRSEQRTIILTVEDARAILDELRYDKIAVTTTNDRLRAIIEAKLDEAKGGTYRLDTNERIEAPGR